MSCEHGVYRREYCQMCTPGCGGGIMAHDKPTVDKAEQKEKCPACLSTNNAFDFETEIFVCLECGFTL